MLTTGTSRFTVGQRDDVVIAGDWACSGTATPALLRPATGEVYVFPSWPGAGQRVAGRLVATVAGAVGLRPSRVTTDRCAHLSALSGDGGVVPVDTGALR
ncbi:MAG TPA: hypothetical protein VFA94_13425 [Acidimicrobiales bacterium]|nr:hypothetical protein [Acidimicrobiales bacterium]